MKRIISAVLAVLMCVLTLSGCEKTPTGQESGGGSNFAESDEASESEDSTENSESEDSEQEEVIVPKTEYVVDGNTVTAKIAVLVNEGNEWYYSNISFNGVVEISFEIPDDWELIPLCDEAGVLKQLKFDAEWNNDPDGVANICVYADCGNTYAEHSDYTALLTWKDEYHYFELITPYIGKASCVNLHYPAYREGDDGW